MYKNYMRNGKNLRTMSYWSRLYLKFFSQLRKVRTSTAIASANN